MWGECGVNVGRMLENARYIGPISSLILLPTLPETQTFSEPSFTQLEPEGNLGPEALELGGIV